jgi:TonB family protein
MKLFIFLAISKVLYLTGIAQQTLQNTTVNTSDTVIKYIDDLRRIQPKINATIVQYSWPEAGKYKLHEYTNDADKKLMGFAWYADAALQVLDGPFENYYPDGKLKNRGNFVNKIRQGIYESWYENGTLNSVKYYTNGILTDTGKVFSKEGTLINLSVTDKEGSGIQTEYYPDGSINLTGPLLAGKKNGVWTVKRENGTNLMIAEFKNDTVTQTTCFADDGTTLLEGVCIFQKSASFQGGNQGWRNYLTKNLKYPKEAMQNDIQGTVMLEFTINTDGTLEDIRVISSPGQVLSDEALRLIKLSPNWEPAIKFNEPVKGKIRQPITFMFQ